MSFDFKRYNLRFLQEGSLVLNSERANNDPLTRFGARVQQANVSPGESYWKVIGIHHLKPVENRGRGNIYLEVLDANGQRVNAPAVWATHEVGSIHETVKLDKPPQEPIGNIPMFAGRHSVQLRGLSSNANDKSDRVVDLHTDHPDEPQPPDGLGGSTRFHHSFYVVFQQARGGGSGPIPDVVDFEQFASAQGLGAPLTRKFTLQEYQVQAFEGGVVFTHQVAPTILRHQRW
jgi:hypothetical protein